MSDHGRWHARLRVAVCAIVLLLLPAAGGCGRSPQHLKSGQCKPGDPLAGVYLPSRLAVHNPCTTVAGTVDCVQAEPDGDIHIRLRPDPAYRRLLTAANAFQQCPQQKDPHLVVEIIPQVGHGAFEDNSATKAGFATPTAPAAGEHVTVTGPYVWDSNLLHDLVYPGRDVKDWAEIHPAWNITIDQPAHKPVA
ncbi:MAG: hypothetical protein E6F99_29355 [Actinobacteria bacterium]|nr:MAG: hypothetical protein E6F99_29355 [Actinomycetota bacterium]